MFKWINYQELQLDIDTISISLSSSFVKGEDKNNWVTVDSKTGQVSVAKAMDRESPFVKNSTYSVIMYVVENGKKQ